MTDDHRTTFLAVIAAMKWLLQVDLPKAIENIGRAHAIGPILDPTLYREKHRAMEEDEQLFRAALPLWRLAKEIRDDALEKLGEPLP